jgi:hypothetical protein
MSRLTIITGLVLLGLSAALSQEANRATQMVSFGVHRTNVVSLQDRNVPLETSRESSWLKVTVAPGPLVDRSRKDPLPLRTGTAHLDVSIVRAKDLDAAVRNKPMLVTITN